MAGEKNFIWKNKNFFEAVKSTGQVTYLYDNGIEEVTEAILQENGFALHYELLQCGGECIPVPVFLKITGWPGDIIRGQIIERLRAEGVTVDLNRRYAVITTSPGQGDKIVEWSHYTDHENGVIYKTPGGQGIPDCLMNYTIEHGWGKGAEIKYAPVWQENDLCLLYTGGARGIPNFYLVDLEKEEVIEEIRSWADPSQGENAIEFYPLEKPEEEYPPSLVEFLKQAADFPGDLEEYIFHAATTA